MTPAVAGSADNTSGEPLVNVASREVGTSSFPHPDGTRPSRATVSPDGTTTYHYVGRGA